MNDGQREVIHTNHKKTQYRMIMMIALSLAVFLPCVSIHSMIPRILMAH